MTEADRLRAIINSAISSYNEWLIDDDYDGVQKLHEIMRRMKLDISLAPIKESPRDRTKVRSRGR